MWYFRFESLTASDTPRHAHQPASKQPNNQPIDQINERRETVPRYIALNLTHRYPPCSGIAGLLLSPRFLCRQVCHCFTTCRCSYFSLSLSLCPAASFGHGGACGRSCRSGAAGERRDYDGWGEGGTERGQASGGRGRRHRWVGDGVLARSARASSDARR